MSDETVIRPSKKRSLADSLRQALTWEWNAVSQDALVQIQEALRIALRAHDNETCDQLVRDWHSAVIDMETPNMDSKLAAQRRVVACETKLHSWAARSSQKACEVRGDEPHDGKTICPPESRCSECWPESVEEQRTQVCDCDVGLCCKANRRTNQYCRIQPPASSEEEDRG